MKFTNNLKTRPITEKAREILLEYLSLAIDNTTAHNKLLGEGIYLTENNELFDY